MFIDPAGSLAATMFEQRFYVEGLAQASYLFGAEGKAAVVDPKRDVEEYLVAAERQGLKIVAIFETHPHADFVSGHLELAKRTGAKIYVSHKAPVSYPHVGMRAGDVVSVGNLEVVALETPGHSPDSMSFLVREGSKPVSVFTGDTLFVGDVGRIDLRDAEEKPAVLAEALHRSLHEVLLQLPPDVRVLPGHGAGSLCGRSIGTQSFSTIGQEKAGNWALQISGRAQFVERMLGSIPDRPAYFRHDVEMNLRGAPALDELEVPRRMNAVEFERAAAATTVLDTRPGPIFGAGHLPGSINIPIDLQLFSTWVGFLVGCDLPILLVADSAERMMQARLELARIGYDEICGWTDDAPGEQQITQISAADLSESRAQGIAPSILDVRTPAEWKDFHIEGSIHIPLTLLPQRMGELRKEEPLAVICGAGNRSAIAVSLLQAGDFKHLRNVMGGMAAYRRTERFDWQPADLVLPGEGI
jgi:hydroxyacylglutathione hydrolase